VVEEVLQLSSGECSPVRSGLGVLDVHRAIPVKTDLCRVRSEQPFAQNIPAIIRMSNISAERAQSLLITANRGLLCVALGTQIPEELVGMRRRPCPRIFVSESLEAPDDRVALINGREG
jgi:hypothetical protein